MNGRIGDQEEAQNGLDILSAIVSRVEQAFPLAYTCSTCTHTHTHTHHALTTHKHSVDRAMLHFFHIDFMEYVYAAFPQLKCAACVYGFEK